MEVLGGSHGLVVMGEGSCPKVVGSNPGTWMDIFSHLFVVKIVMSVWKDENKWKRGRDVDYVRMLIRYNGCDVEDCSHAAVVVVVGSNVDDGSNLSGWLFNAAHGSDVANILKVDDGSKVDPTIQILMTVHHDAANANVSNVADILIAGDGSNVDYGSKIDAG